VKLTPFQRGVLTLSLYPPRDARAYRRPLERPRAALRAASFLVRACIGGAHFYRRRGETAASFRVYAEGTL
jgi:hypothetical protein